MNIEAIALITAFASVVIVGALLVYIIRNRPATAGSVDAGSPIQLDELASKLAGEQAVVASKIEQVDTRLAALQTAVDKKEGAIERQMTDVSSSVAGIASLFNNDRQRGNWGELSLERIFEVAGLVEGRDYENQFTGGEGKPDAVVFLPGDQTIVIDAKFPVARYLEAMAVSDPGERQRLLTAHGKELENVGQSLVKKHYADNATAGYVIVFVPSQAVYETAAEAHPDVVERLMQQGVIVAGPTAVFALIKTAGSLMAQHRAVRDAREIVGEVRELRNRLGTFTGYFEKVGKSLSTASREFNKAIGSWNSRLGPSVNRIAEMAGTNELTYLDEVTETIGATAPNALKEAM